jgi:hypothetical protein
LLHQTPCHLAHTLPPCRGAKYACTIAGVSHTHIFEACMVVTMMITVVWDVTVCSPGHKYRHFWGTSCLHREGKWNTFIMKAPGFSAKSAFTFQTTCCPISENSNIHRTVLLEKALAASSANKFPFM